MIEKIWKNPILLSIVFGIGGVVLAVVSFMAIYFILMILDNSDSAAGVLGFVVAPLYVFAGYPWSFGILKLGGGYNVLAGIFINSALLGLILSLYSWLLRRLNSKK